MAMFPNNNQSGDEKIEPEKKIEFANKLSAEDMEGESSSKGGDFDFLKGFEPRQPGEKKPVQIVEEKSIKADVQKISSSVKKNQAENKTGGFLKFGGGADRGKNQSQALQVNLVKDEIIKYFDWQKGALLILLVIFTTLAVISALYWGIFSIWGSDNSNEQNNSYLQQYYKISKKLGDLNPQVAEIKNFKTSLDRADFLLARHIYWTNFFSFLEDNTLSNVYFSGFGGSIGGAYGLSATTDNLSAINPQVKKLLDNPDISQASVSAGTIGGAGGKPVVSFSLSFVVNRKVFLK
jgi:hypothetical protein